VATGAARLTSLLLRRGQITWNVRSGTLGLLLLVGNGVVQTAHGEALNGACDVAFWAATPRTFVALRFAMVLAGRPFKTNADVASILERDGEPAKSAGPHFHDEMVAKKGPGVRLALWHLSLVG
jgi:hypothetical protein